MDFIDPVVNILCRLCYSIASRVGLVLTLDERVPKLATALKELKEMRDDLKGRVHHAESQGLMPTSQVKRWLEKVEVIETEVGSIVEEFEQQRKCFVCCNANCCSKYRLSGKVAETLSEINEVMDKGEFNAIVAAGLLPVVVEEMPCRPSVGQESMLEKVQQFLREDEAGIIGIYGISGVGKTTLLKNVNNSFLTEPHWFDVVIWISVSKDFVAEKIQQAIGVRLGLSWDEAVSREQQALKIYRVMKRKRFLLLLDDVWEGLDFDEIGIPFPDKKSKCKVIFTTRSKEVCSDMDAHRKVRVGFLGEEESWQLFKEKIGQREILDSQSIRGYAKTIIRKCGGLPLALITIGRAMACKETEEDWKRAIQVLSKAPLEFRGMENVFTHLKFSYDNLDNDILRMCFLYCTMFPEDYSIEEEQLIEYWIGEGFLDSWVDIDVNSKGRDLIDSLKVACLLETGTKKSQVMMHDIVRSFALWIVSEHGINKKFIIQASAGLAEAPEVENWERAQRVSLLDNEISELSDIPVCPDLSTLMLQWNRSLNTIQNGVFQCMPALKVLDLSFTCLREIPAAIGCLVELRHLNLSGTKVTKLPRELGGLVKLRHLDLQRIYSLETIPRKAISGLAQLRVLNLYYSYGNWEEQGCEGEYEVGFADLTLLKYLTTLGITVTKLTSLNTLSNFHVLLTCIQYLYITQCENLFRLKLSSPSDHGKRLRRLSINNCCNFKYLEIHGDDSEENWLPSLEILALHRLPNLSTIWRNPVTPRCLLNLRSITVWHCQKLKNVSWVLQLPRLEEIYLFYCKEMEEIINEDAVVLESFVVFPSLRTISIRGLPELKSISQQALAFHSLESFSVIDCPKLKKLPLEVGSGSTLLTVYGNKEWWDGLEWSDATTKSKFLPHFKAT